MKAPERRIARNQPLLVSPKRAAKIQMFGRALSRLCRKYNLELATDDTTGINVYEPGVEFPDGYTWSGYFHGVDACGVFFDFGPNKREHKPIEIADLLEEDWIK